MPGTQLLFWPGLSICSRLLNNRLCVLRPGLALVGRKGPVRPQRNRKRKWCVRDSRRVWGGGGGVDSNMKGKQRVEAIVP